MIALAANTDRAFSTTRARLRRHGGVVVGATLSLILLFIALVGPIIAPYSPTAVIGRPLTPPSWSFPMGTDNLGRDVLSRVLTGARLSLSVGIVAVLVGATLGTLIGVVAGVAGGWTDVAAMRFIDALMAFPGVLLALAIAAALGANLRNAMIAVGIAWVPTFARLVRANVLQVKRTAYVEAADALGCSRARLILRHVLPNSLTPVIVLLSLSLAGAILAGTALSFLGLGPQPPTPEWGAMLSQSRQFMSRAWWPMAFPGLAIAVTIFTANLLGTSLRDILDPRLRVR
jgi:peptide/nickel transport system permease protein